MTQFEMVVTHEQQTSKNQVMTEKALRKVQH